MSTHQGANVTASRPAKQGDPNFDASKGSQVVITLQDGSEKTVPQSEVKN